MIRINLLKPEKKDLREEIQPKPEKERKFDLAKALIIISLFLVGVLFISQRSAIRKESVMLEKARKEKEKLLYVFSKLEELEKQKALYERKINLIRELKSFQDTPVRVMDGLSEEIPPSVWLTQCTFDNNVVHIKGRAFSNSAIADYISNLEINPYFDDVNLIASIQRRIKNIDIHEFSLTAHYTFSQETGSQEAGGNITGENK
ncbi:MAG: PilN domain-containing protein [Candidatus Aminicenantales bacterium]